MTIEAKKLQLIRQLMEVNDEAVLDKMKAVIGEAHSAPVASASNEALRALLLAGPVMSDEEYEDYLEIRNWMNEWRA